MKILDNDRSLKHFKILYNKFLEDHELFLINKF